jgi:hypothetical protein
MKQLDGVIDPSCKPGIAIDTWSSLANPVRISMGSMIDEIVVGMPSIGTASARQKLLLPSEVVTKTALDVDPCATPAQV